MTDMKKIILILIIFPGLLPAPAQQTQNYVLTSAVNNSGVLQNSYQYYDAMGRPFERVEVGITPSHSNLAWLSDYDGIGRPSKDWLPATVSAAYIQPSTLRSTGYSAYSDTRPFAETLYDDSPLNRETAAKGTGQQWTAHYRSTDYLINTGTFPLSCRNYYVNASGSLSDLGLFPASRLSVMRLTDEDGRVTLEFRDHQERIVLVRRMLSENSSADTYYVYDRRGDLRYVLQPEYQQSADLDKYAFRYTYDARHNVVEKHLPGAGAVTYGYDLKNQLIFSQDGVQRQAGRITFMLYDLHGRLLVRGTCDEESWTEEYPQDELYSTPALASFSATASGLGGSGYETNLTLLDASVEEAHYYDGYDFLSCNGFSVQAFPAGTVNAKGLETGSVVNTLDGTATRLYTVNYYDEKGRQTKRISTNLLGGTETTESTYGYTDKPLTVSHTHTAEGKATQVEIYSYEYDHADRLTKVSHSLNGGAAVVLKENTYDNYGRLVSQNLMGSETVGHSYNIRNWPTSISSSHFTELMEYASGQHPFFNGNVSRMLWRTSGESSFRVYDFQYDGLNRLTSAAYGGQGNFSTGYGYDLNGNLTCLTRNGRLSGDTYGRTDSLTFTYNGNQVTRIDDAAGNATGTGRYDFRNGANQDGEYAYDANGNITKDLNKNLASVQYNSRNLPERIDFTDGKYITYVYDATGRKLRVNYRPSQTATTGPQTDYCGNVQYENGTLKRILVDGGCVSFSGGTPYYYYYLTDHLGSNRVVMNKSTGATIQVNHYYPYGGLFAGSTNVAGLYYKYNGKEIDHRYNLELSDYGARFYDALRASWLTMDPLCEKYYDLSPYAMCGDNPVNAFDYNGEAWGVTVDMNTGKYTGYQWVSPDKAYNDGGLKPGLYEQAIFFTSQGESGKKFDPASNYNMGSSTAVVYTTEGDILTFNASTYPSDINQYATVPEGLYEGQLGVHHGSSGSYPAIRVGDVGTNAFGNNSINLNKPNPSNPKTNSATGINIHKPGMNNKTGMTNDGKAISKGCLLIDITQWSEFIRIFQNNPSSTISITVSRTIEYPTDETKPIDIKDDEKQK